jgi:hypothetical protein
VVFFEDLVSSHTFSAVMAGAFSMSIFVVYLNFLGIYEDMFFFFQNVSSLRRSPVCSIFMSPLRSQNSPGKHGLATEFVNMGDIFNLFVPGER